MLLFNNSPLLPVPYNVLASPAGDAPDGLSDAQTCSDEGQARK